MTICLFLTLTGATSGFLVNKIFKDLVIADDKISDLLPYSPGWAGLFSLFSATSSLKIFLFLFWLFSKWILFINKSS